MLEDGFIIQSQYLDNRVVSHAIRIAIKQMQVSSHQLEIETGRPEIYPERDGYADYTLEEVETEEHFLYYCAICNEI